MPTRRQALYAAIAAVFAACLIVPPGAGGATAEPADAFIRTMGNEAIRSLTGAALSAEQREARFREILTRAFDMPTIARFTMGRYWRIATAAQRREYIELFEEFVVGAYAARFKDYSGERVEVGQVREINEREKLVASEIVRPGQPTIAVHWRVRADDGYKIIDVMVEGVSMGITQRDEFAAVIRASGGKVEGLLAALRRKTGREQSAERATGR